MLIRKTFKLSHLMSLYYHPDEIFEYCRSCENFNQNYSCPSHDSPPVETLPHDAYITICLLKRVYSDSIDLEETYINERVSLDRVIHGIEQTSDTVALIPGRCLICSPCAKSVGKACPYPELMRYSLETLGFNISEILSKEFKYELSWNKSEITYVFGFIHDPERLEQIESLIDRLNVKY